MRMIESERKTVEVADIRVYCNPELKRVASEAADAARLPLSEFVVQALAKSLGREDLSEIPRISYGRPRKEIRPANGHQGKRNGVKAKAS